MNHVNNNYSVSDLKKHPLYKSVKGRGKMKKKELIDAINTLLVGGGLVKVSQKNNPVSEYNDWVEMMKKKIEI